MSTANSTALNLNESLTAEGAWSGEDNSQWHLHMIKRNECLTLLQEEVTQTISDLCPRVWDQLLCWPPTPPETHVFIPCHDTYAFSKALGNATRYCQQNGVWAGNNVEQTENGWTNYTACLDAQPPHSLIYDWLPIIRQFSIIGYSFSLVTLIISFGILGSLRKLRCPRNVLHLHLFASFIMRAVVVLVKSFVLSQQTDEPSGIALDHPGDAAPETWWCKLLITIWQYFILANYSWILMEGLYLHNLIFMALFSDSSAITKHVILGWGLPLLCVVVWASLKISFDDMQCWTVNHVQWIFWLCIRIPVALSNFVNFFFFMNVTRVLVLKLRSSINPESMKYRKLAKSTLVLVPLFGVHYFLLWGLSTSSDSRVELAWLLLDQVFSSFQGFCVAVLYCLMNGEVRQELRKLYHRFRGEDFANATYSTVVSHTRTYCSKGRPSCNSLQLGTDKPPNQHTPSPQFPRNCEGNSPCNPFSNAAVFTPTGVTTNDELKSLPTNTSNNGNVKVDAMELLPSWSQDERSKEEAEENLLLEGDSSTTQQTCAPVATQTKEFVVSLQNSVIHESPKMCLLGSQSESML